MPRLSKIGAAALAAFGWTSGATAVTSTYLVVGGGGGGGGQYYAGGGGAGGYLTGTMSLNPSLSYTVTVGAGGVAGNAARGGSGGSSVFNAITASGGGGGGANAASGQQDGASGASGGGGASYGVSTTGAGGAGNTPSTSPSQGNNGGSGNVGSGSNYNAAGGGGGGSGGTGSNASVAVGGNGGAGTSNSISGSALFYAGGGGGGAEAGTGGTGGSSVGGNGQVGTGTAATAGTANRGGGGGGTGYSANGGNGGSGVVIISYSGAQKFSGGIVTSVGGNTIHTFTTSGTLGPITTLSASYLIVAGGGGGGFGDSQGGGGGAGGLLTGSTTIDPSSTYLVTVGAGGAGKTSAGGTGVSGSNSVFGIVATAAVGGGGGGTSGVAGLNGGSGGGSANATATSGTSGQGNGGGVNGGSGGVFAAGGGGGAGATGGTSSTTTGGLGGIGVSSSISGTATYYAGGGGGGTGGSGGSNVGTGGTGGTGGGGNGAAPGASTAGTANTGGGGGGGGGTGVNNGSAGGSGIVIISYPGSTQQMAGGTVTIVGGNVIHTFTSTGYLAPIKYVSNSLRFRSSASANLTWTPTSAPTSGTKWTMSAWVKYSVSDNGAFNSPILTASDGSGLSGVMFEQSPNTPHRLFVYNCGVQIETTAVYRDPAAWYHIVATVDNTQATSSERTKLYVNGVQVTALTTATYPAQNTVGALNASGVVQYIGRQSGTSRYFDGYIAEMNVIDGQALTPNSFGTFNSYGVWQPITYGGSYGTNGFYLPFTNNASTTTLGYDFSPNGNNWTPNNISLTAGATYDSMTDVPTLTSATAANYCVWNAVLPNQMAGGSASITNGNLTASDAGTSYGVAAQGSFGVTSGKWYWEVTASTVGGNYGACGIRLTTVQGTDGAGYFYFSDGQKVTTVYGGGAASYGNSYTSGDVIGVALDMDNGKIWFSKNGTWQASGDPAAGTNAAYTGLSGSFSACVGDGQNATQYVWNATFGQRPFAYTPPSGFVALNTYNL